MQSPFLCINASFKIHSNFKSCMNCRQVDVQGLKQGEVIKTGGLSPCTELNASRFITLQ